MNTDIGEQLVGAYLKVIRRCHFILYNVRPPGGGFKGLEEIDVIGINLKEKAVYLCEVATHLGGLDYGGNRTTINTLKKKYERLVQYADQFLPEFPERHFMIWSPYVPKGYLTEQLNQWDNLELIINHHYRRALNRLRKEAAARTNDEGNDAFRLLQIIGHLRK